MDGAWLGGEDQHLQSMVRRKVHTLEGQIEVAHDGMVDALDAHSARRCAPCRASGRRGPLVWALTQCDHSVPPLGFEPRLKRV